MLCFRKTLVTKKRMVKTGGGVSRLCVDGFLSHMPKNFTGEPFCVSLTPVIEKFYAADGYVTFFCRKIFVSQYPKVS